MAKVSKKSEKITPFGGIFHVREHFPVSRDTDLPLSRSALSPVPLNLHFLILFLCYIGNNAYICSKLC